MEREGRTDKQAAGTKEKRKRDGKKRSKIGEGGVLEISRQQRHQKKKKKREERRLDG